MSTDKSTTTSSSKGTSFSLGTLSLDAWALIVAALLALAVRFDILKNVSTRYSSTMAPSEHCGDRTGAV